MKAPHLVLATALGIAAFGACSTAAAEGPNSWRVVGTKTVAGSDSDTIDLPGDRRFRQIRLCAYNQPIRMRELDVRFANGRNQDIEVRHRINPGTCTRNIDLQGELRDIASIHMRYEPILGGGGRPLVKVEAR